VNLPEFWIVAGPNGAGKTTCVQAEPISSILPAVTFLNPDDLTLSKLRAIGYAGFVDAPIEVQTRLFIESAKEVFDRLTIDIAACRPVGVETVLSTEKYSDPSLSVRIAGGFVGLIYIALSSPALAMERVAARVRRGGHGIPDAKIEQRWQRSLYYLAPFAKSATAFWVFDNSDSNPTTAPALIASGKLGCLEYLDDEQTFPEMKSALSMLPRK
jgi:predicted ABC-type ATPase